MSDTLSINVDVSDVLKALDGLNEAAMVAAWRRTLRKTAAWVKGKTAKAVSHEAQISLKIIRSRLAVLDRSRDAQEIRLNLRNIAARRLGKPRQPRHGTGVIVGGRSFPGAFLQKSRGRDEVFKREGAARYPIRVEKIEWAEQGKEAFLRVIAETEARLMVILRQEVNYELQKALGNAR
jgi:hypothetical protein